jgi:aspartate aminotransferase
MMSLRTNTIFLFLLAAATSRSLADSFPVDASSTQTSAWKNLKAGPPDAILGIAQAFRESQDPRKVNVCVGAYRDAQGKSWVLPSVRQAEAGILAEEDKDYLPIEGDAGFIEQALRFAYGEDEDLKCIAGVQTLSGTGACRIGGAFLANFWPGQRKIYIPTPTWGNHWKIFESCGLETAPYRYYDRDTNRLDLEGMLQDISDAPEESIILLHAVAHNPTGCDPTLEQWDQIAKVLEKKGHCAFFDSAYQGFASGDAERDAASFRSVVAGRNVPILLAQSFAKNFGLYGERCGTLSVVGASDEERQRLISQLRCVIRPMYSSPPRHGSSIVKRVLSDDTLSAQYYTECASMADRIKSMRLQLVEALQKAGSKHDWSHVKEQIGMVRTIRECVYCEC